MTSKETIRKELLSIHERDGCLRPPIVIQEAEPENHPLHPCFEWDDSKAAHEHRLWQARQLIRTVIIEVKGEDEKKEHLFFHTRDDDNGPRYQTKEVLYQEPDLLESALALAKGKVSSASRAVSELIAIAQQKVPKKQKRKYERAGKLMDQAQEALL